MKPTHLLQQPTSPHNSDSSARRLPVPSSRERLHGLRFGKGSFGPRTDGPVRRERCGAIRESIRITSRKRLPHVRGTMSHPPESRSVTQNVVYIATSIDGFIATSDGGIDWLESVPNPENSDYGFAEFMSTVDAVAMGRRTFEKVAGFKGEWPYSKPVIVLSRTLASLPEGLKADVSLASGDAETLSKGWKQQGLERVYIDGGETVRSFLEADLIDEMIISRIPVVLGGGIPLFGGLRKPLRFSHVSTGVLSGQIVKTHYKRVGSGG